MVSDFLFELGCEELPSAAVWPLADAFANHLLAAFDKAKLTYGEVSRFATPRRLALLVRDLTGEQKSTSITRKGPAAVAAYDANGNPTAALLGFAKSCGVAIEDLTTLSTDKGDWIVYETPEQNTPTQELLPTFINQALSDLPIAKPMRWGDNQEAFVRPVHWAVLLYGNQVVEMTLLGVKTSNQSYGHRFHYPGALTLAKPGDYEATLLGAFVQVDFAKRQLRIKEQVQALATLHQASAIMPAALLDEVTSIVEWPQALIVQFDPAFLDVPAEALIASMQTHQKCFALKDNQGLLLPHFITVANIESLNSEQVIAGNEKVMRARLSDAAFFYREDKKRALSSYILATERVVFQEKLGSLQDKAQRLDGLMLYLSRVLSLSDKQAIRVAELCKCDLMTGMVGEFPELEGLMGYYYALHDGEDAAVAQALNEQYMPRFAADNLPVSKLGMALSLADRLDTLVGIFAIGLKPTGVKDPFKLRRHALAIVRLLLSSDISLSLSALIHEVKHQYGDQLVIGEALVSEIKVFILERLLSYYQGQGVLAELVYAARARQEDCLTDLDLRVKALQAFLALPEAVALSAACKRVSNLLQSIDLSIVYHVNIDLLEEGPEKALYEAIKAVSEEVAPLYVCLDYALVLKKLASLKQPLDTFFDKVMVMVDNPELKKNRLALLATLQDLMQGVADIGLL